jgi:hypothetical protein
LERIKELGIIPNFYISETYINQKSITANEKNGWVWLSEKEWDLFPALPISNEIIQGNNPVTSYWCGFPRNLTTTDYFRFFDNQYIYDPKSFNDLSGGKWESFRKNINKFERKNNPIYTDIKKDRPFWILIEKWFDNKMNSVLDGDFIMDCITNPKKGDYIRYLYDQNENMVAINYVDENYLYINYRFIICDKTKFADEYARYCFYTDTYIQSKNKLVNDGGNLGNSGLEKFKDKLNPKEKFKIYSKLKYKT